MTECKSLPCEWQHNAGVFCLCAVGISLAVVLAWHLWFAQKYISSYREPRSNLTSSAPLIALEASSTPHTPHAL